MIHTLGLSQNTVLSHGITSTNTERFLILFGRNVARNVRSRTVDHFRTSPKQFFCTTQENSKPKTASFHLDAECLFCQKNTNIRIITWSQLVSFWSLASLFRTTISISRPLSRSWPIIVGWLKKIIGGQPAQPIIFSAAAELYYCRRLAG